MELLVSAAMIAYVILSVALLHFCRNGGLERYLIKRVDLKIARIQRQNICKEYDIEREKRIRAELQNNIVCPPQLNVPQ